MPLMDLTTPVELYAVEVLRDSNGRAQAYFTFLNCAAQSIASLYATLTLLDDAGASLGSLPLPGAVGAAEGAALHAFSLFFGPALVTPAVMVSRGISFYSFLLLSGLITLCVHIAVRRRAPVRDPKPPAAPARLPKAGGTAALG